ncbi:TPA: staphostatin A [Staphylococcus aureus]|uniref:staphostatin A n=1 Tax=Staphylococcus aureus TaxID=1280 RepID=UPI00139BF4DF|nr:staphostatin A [Staphylococcus aureus]NDP32215.1 staphostatin A [Staphylococcus aureus]NDP54717.1 staphostatin A [Staphylococcus aureus]NDP96241.1 staphostatin A [Staphylococcus aureus]NDQ09278.1 staphostatin A [Staphylococcus aureus]
MSKYQLINIGDQNLDLLETNYAHVLKGEWNAENIETKPLKITFNDILKPIYTCEKIDEDSRMILLKNKMNPNLIIEIVIVSSEKIIFNAFDNFRIGTTPKITFVKA